MHRLRRIAFPKFAPSISCVVFPRAHGGTERGRVCFRGVLAKPLGQAAPRNSAAHRSDSPDGGTSGARALRPSLARQGSSNIAAASGPVAGRAVAAERYVFGRLDLGHRRQSQRRRDWRVSNRRPAKHRRGQLQLSRLVSIMTRQPRRDLPAARDYTTGVEPLALRWGL